MTRYQMRLKEMKIKTFSLIEEYYPDVPDLAEDEDVINKINGVVNQIIMDLMKYRKLPASKEVEIKEKDSKILDLSELLADCYQISNFYFGEEVVDYKMPNETTLILPEEYVGTVTIYYYKFPKLAKTMFENDDERTAEDNNFIFEQDPDILEIMPYGIAADLLKMDMISNYGSYFYQRYTELKQMIDSRKTKGLVIITGGVDI
mgnify:CR=1 FL=1